MAANPCFPSQIKEFPFTQDEVADIWKLAKENYIDQGKSFQETISGMARDLGMRKEHIAQAFTMPKVTRVISNDLWQKLNARREAISQSRQVVQAMNDSAFKKTLETAYNVPRSALTFGHGGVFPMTHMGQYIFTPSRWGTFLKTSANAWRFMSDKQYEVAIQRHLADPYYDIARRASKSVDPGQETVGILRNMKGWTGKGFNALKIARLDLFKKEFTLLPKEEQTLANAKPIMNVVDAATGEVNLGQLGKYLSKALFAPKLLPARFKSALVDPYRAVKTFANWKTATAGERQAARFVMKQQAQTIVFYAGAMALNEGVNRVVGSNNHVNFTDPKKSDWLAFKIGGLTIRPPNALIEVLRLGGGMIAPFISSQKSLRGEQPESVAAHRVADYLRYKLHPSFRIASEVASGTDLFGRALPFSGVRQLATGEPAKVTAKKPQIQLPEYILGKGPIPLGGGAREFYDMLREEGMSHPQAKDWIRAAAVMAIEGEGITAHESHAPAQ